MKRKNPEKKLTALLLCATVLLACCAGMIVPAKAENIPVPDVSYSGNWPVDGVFGISTNQTVMLSDMTYDCTAGSAILISNNATVHLIIDGNVTISGSSSYICAGIEVEEGSTLHLYGTEGSRLTVTGGKYGAGIGGKGYREPSTTNKKAGNIIIHSGTITTTGGINGAGIGSGHHSSASEITILGGDISALGTGGGAGIGSGYGTSGGASYGAQVGYYSGGNITISGGTVRAAAVPRSNLFDTFDPYDPATWPEEDTFAAGIGGGYGASSGKIIIEGDAEVTAIGTCGGAGIGSGRGTNTKESYSSGCVPVDVTIRGNARVTACATLDDRSNVKGDMSGAAIGLGRAMTYEGTKTGSVRIGGNAVVFAYAQDHAAAIGGSWKVEKILQGQELLPSSIAKLDTLTVEDTATVVAVNDGFVPPVDLPVDTPWVRLDMTADEFTAISGRTPCPVNGIVLYSVGCAGTGKEADPQILVPVTLDAKRKVMVQVPGYSGNLFFTDGTWALKNDQERVCCFFAPVSSAAEYPVTDIIPARYAITWHPNGGTNSPDNPDSYLIYALPLTLKSAVLADNAFIGWFDNEQCEGEAVTVIPTGNREAKELWAKWSAILYSVSESEGAEHIIGSGEDAVYTVKRNINDEETFSSFTGATVDGKAIPEGGSTAEKGSLVLTLKSGYLDTLAEGDHKVTISFTDGTVEANLTVKAATPTPSPSPAPTPTPRPIPVTGDSSHPDLWFGLVLLGILLLSVLAVRKA